MAETILEERVRKAGEQGRFSSEDIVGKRMKNPEGYDLGEISTLRISLPAGNVAYAVLRTGGMLGIGSKLFAIPVEAMIYRPGDDVFLVNISKHRLDSEPGFSEREWPEEANWNLIESGRPMSPPSQEEARAVTRTESSPREIITTERVVVEERASTMAKTVEEGGALMAAGAASPSIADLQVYLKGMDYPAGKQDLLDHARKNNAPESIITTIEKFSDQTYQSAADASSEFERIG